MHLKRGMLRIWKWRVREACHAHPFSALVHVVFEMECMSMARFGQRLVPRKDKETHLREYLNLNIKPSLGPCFFFRSKKVST